MKEKIIEIIFYLSLFIFIVGFFNQIHPLVPFCTDDWINLSIGRGFYPDIHEWNPTKVLPECLEPTIATIGAFFIYPLNGDYISSITLANAITAAFFILIYIFSLQRLMLSKYKISNYCCYTLLLIYILLHFYILLSQKENNEYLWRATDTNCFFHYIIPTLVSASFCLWLMRSDIHKMTSCRTWSFLGLTTYLILLSNLYSSVLLVAYCGADMIIDIIKKKKIDKTWILQNTYSLIVVGAWLIVQLIEVNGPRATAYGNLDAPWGEALIETLQYTIHAGYSKGFILISVITIITYIFLNLRNKKKTPIASSLSARILLSLVFAQLYLILLSSKVLPENMLKGEVIFGFVFFYLVLFVLSLEYLCTRKNFVKIFLIYFAGYMFFEMNTTGNVFKDVLYEYDYSPQTLMQYDRDFIRQVVKADNAGQDTVYIDVPPFIRPGKYPLSDDCSELVGITLFRHGITKNNITTFFSTAKSQN